MHIPDHAERTRRVSSGATTTTPGVNKIRSVAQRELRNQSAAVPGEVESGRTIIVGRNGTLVEELRPMKRRRFVPRAAIADAAGRAARIDHDQIIAGQLPDESAITAVALAELATGPHAIENKDGRA